MENRIATVFCDNYLAGEDGKNVAMLECDEGNVEKVMPKIEADCLVITNLFPDQIHRFKSEEQLANRLCEAMRNTKPATCILSKNCHFHDKLVSVPGWKFIHYDENENENIPKLQIPGAFNLINARAAMACAHFWGIDEDAIIRGLEKTRPAFGRFEVIEAGSSKCTFCLIKNWEGFRAVNEWLMNEDHDTFTKMVLAVNQNDGDDHDLSWIEESDFSGMSSLFKKIYVTGHGVETTARLIRQSGSEPVKIPIEEVLSLAEKHSGNMLILENYSAMLQIRQQFADGGYAKEYWE